MAGGFFTTSATWEALDKFRGSYSLLIEGFPGDVVVKNLPASSRDTRDIGLIPVSGRSAGGGNGILLQYCYLENSMDSGAWQAPVHSLRVCDTHTHERVTS